jgi:hypothetical protein
VQEPSKASVFVDEPAGQESETGLGSTVHFLKTVSDFLMRRNETDVVLSNGDQRLKFSVVRDKVLDFFNLFSDLTFDQKLI